MNRSDLDPREYARTAAFNIRLQSMIRLHGAANAMQAILDADHDRALQTAPVSTEVHPLLGKTVTFRKAFAESRQRTNEQTWFAEGVTGVVLRVDVQREPIRAASTRRRTLAPTGYRDSSKAFIEWTTPQGTKVTNYLPLGAIKAVR